MSVPSPEVDGLRRLAPWMH